MKELSPEEILVGTLNSEENTWKNRFNAVIPDIKMNETNIVLSNSNFSVNIDSFDEIVLTITLKFLFVPVWLIKQFYQTWMIAGIDQEFKDKIDDWVKIGLVWKEAAVTGQYIRPTYLLFKLFGVRPERFYNIPFNTLTHTISEEKVMFDVMSNGINIFNLKINYLPRVSELGFADDERGTNIIVESDFRNPKLLKPEGIKELSDTEHTINEAMKNGETITPELLNFNQFTLVKKINNTGMISKDYLFHIPDLIIPLPRIDGKPQSIAIEVELSNKRYGYEETMKRYKDNNKYGTVLWLCNTPAIVQNLKLAYETTKGTGSCKTYLQEFVTPTPDF